MTEPQPDFVTAEMLPPSETRARAVLRQHLTLEEYLHLDDNDTERPEADQGRNTTSTSSKAKLTELKKQDWYWEAWRQAMNAKHTRHTHELTGNLSVAQTSTLEKRITYAKTQRSHASTNTRRIQRQITQLLDHRRPRRRPQQDKNMEVDPQQDENTEVDQPAEASSGQQEDQPMETTESPQNAAEQTDRPASPRRREQRSDSSSS